MCSDFLCNTFAFETRFWALVLSRGAEDRGESGERLRRVWGQIAERHWQRLGLLGDLCFLASGVPSSLKNMLQMVLAGSLGPGFRTD